jgi:hypothetical protein
MMVAAGGREEARVADTLDRDGDAVDVTPRTEVLEGDDIVVIPDEPETHTSRRRRIALVIGAVAVVVAIVVIAAVAAGGNNKSEPQVVAASPNPNLGRTAAPPKASAPTTVKVKTKRSTHQTTPHASATTPARVVVPPSIPNATTPPTAPPALTEFPLSAIRWTAPSSLTIAHDAQTTITVVAHNPTSGTITLPQPLACAPTLSGNGMCTAMAQILAPGETATAHYKIDGGEVSPGNYTLSVEGVLSIKVTVTA